MLADYWQSQEQKPDLAWHLAFAALQKLDCKVTGVMLVSSYLSCKTHVSPDKKIIRKWPVRIG